MPFSAGNFVDDFFGDCKCNWVTVITTKEYVSVCFVCFVLRNEQYIWEVLKETALFFGLCAGKTKENIEIFDFGFEWWLFFAGIRKGVISMEEMELMVSFKCYLGFERISLGGRVMKAWFLVLFYGLAVCFVGIISISRFKDSLIEYPRAGTFFSN